MAVVLGAPPWAPQKMCGPTAGRALPTWGPDHCPLAAGRQLCALET